MEALPLGKMEATRHHMEVAIQRMEEVTTPHTAEAVQRTAAMQDLTGEETQRHMAVVLVRMEVATTPPRDMEEAQPEEGRVVLALERRLTAKAHGSNKLLKYRLRLQAYCRALYGVTLLHGVRVVLCILTITAALLA